MQRKVLLWITILLALAGIADSAYLAEHEVTNTALSCGIGTLSGCNIVAQSAYSHLFGIPLGIYGLVFYGAILLVTLYAQMKPSYAVFKVLLGIAMIGLLFSIYFLGLQLFVIDAICIYCVGSFVLSVLLFITSYFLWRPHRPVAPLIS